MSDQIHRVEADIGGKTVIIETGKLAKLAGGAVTVRCGDSVVLATATASPEPKPGADYFPLSVDYVEKTYAAGKIPGGFFKREGRPSERETLTSRFIDRPIRPLFPDGYMNETQVIVTVLSADAENETDVLAMIGASAALTISSIPFQGPIAGVCVGRVDGKFVLNPTTEQFDRSDLDLIVAGSRDAVVMVEGGSRFISEEDMVSAIMFAHQGIQEVIAVQEKLRKVCGVPKWEVTAPAKDDALWQKAENALGNRLLKAVTTPVKQERYAAIADVKKNLIAEMVPVDDPEAEAKTEAVATVFEDIKKEVVRQMIVKDKKRVDGRRPTEIRPITSEVGLLPRTHGSGLFTRGETQVLAVVTLGSGEDRQIIDNINGEYKKRFMLHYNFPPFSVGEVKFLRSPGRREVGHGALAERALNHVIPDEAEFPYTIRLVSEVLQSNGSSSMGTVCSGTLALMDAGVPITAPVAGIAMGLVKEGDRYVILSDILGDEDHLGDMDFKVTGTAEGITALQMDIKIAGITEGILREALQQAKEGRLHILQKMAETMDAPRAAISKYAPKMILVTIPRDRIGDLIGPGGKNIRAIVEETGAKIDIDDSGEVQVWATNEEAGNRALTLIKQATASPEIGKYYRGKVVRIMDFGALVEIMPGATGLVHISQLENRRVGSVEEIVHEGDEVVVKVLEIEGNGKIRLSRKEALGHESEAEVAI